MKKFLFLALACALPLLTLAQEWTAIPGGFSSGSFGQVYCHLAQGDTVFYGGNVATGPGMSNWFWQWTPVAGLQPALGVAPSPSGPVYSLVALGKDSVFVGGAFANAGTTPLDGSAILTPSGYQTLTGPSGYRLGSTIFSSVSVYRAHLWNDTLFMSGQFQVLDAGSNVISNQSIAKWHPSTGILPLPEYSFAVQGVTSAIVGDTFFVNDINTASLARLSLATGQWNDQIPLYAVINGTYTNGYSADMLAWGDTLLMAGSYYFTPNETLLLGYRNGVFADLDQGQTAHISIIGIDSLQGKIAVSGVSSTWNPTMVLDGGVWAPAGGMLGAFTYGAFEHQGKVYCYGELYFSGSCIPPVNIALLSDTTCAPLALPADSVGTGEDLVTLSEPRVYPNPTNGPLNVELPEGWEGARVWVVDLQGRQLHQQAANGLRAELDLSHLPAGVYLVQINTPHGHNHTERIIRQ